MSSDDIDYYCMWALTKDRETLGHKSYTFTRNAVAKYHHMTYEEIEEFRRDKAEQDQ